MPDHDSLLHDAPVTFQVYQADISVVIRCDCRLDSTPILIPSIHMEATCPACGSAYRLIEASYKHDCVVKQSVFARVGRRVAIEQQSPPTRERALVKQ